MALDRAQCFEFSHRALDYRTGEITLGWAWSGPDVRVDFQERFEIPGVAAATPGRPDGLQAGARFDAIEAALDLLHWVAGISYWKCLCRGEIRFRDRAPDDFQAAVLETVYRDGLAELAWENDLEGRYWPEFAGHHNTARIAAGPVGLCDRVLVPMGGGKDSLVALERVRALGHRAETVQVGSAPLIADVAEQAGTRHRIIGRRLAPELAALNASGVLNGHVPITAINAAVLVVAALLWDFDSVVFANERSADTPTLVTDAGRAVNHQFAKSFAFERLLQQWIARDIASDLSVFSILRQDRELAVCREFAGLEQYHHTFSSCNRNFHLDGPRTSRWCGECPKCLFVYLALAPFLAPDRLRAIFGADLLARVELLERFAALLELEGPRPFECVGEAVEARAAVVALATDGRWCKHVVVRKLAARLEGVSVPPLSGLLAPGGDHAIPGAFRTCA